MKKFFTAILAAFSVLGAVATASGAAEFDHSGYWPLLEAYNAAAKTEGDEDDIAACTAIIEFYGGMKDVTSCQRLVSPSLRLGKIYESMGRYSEARAVFERLYEAQTIVLNTTGDDYGMMYLECLLDQYAYTKPTVYAVTADSDNIPYYGAVGEPVAGAHTGMCDSFDPSISSGALVYVEFSREKMEKYDFRVPDKAENSLEIAWNIPTSGLNIEMFSAIANGDYDEYIIENLTWLQTVVPDTVFLRFAAEVNCWGVISTYAADGRLEEFIDQYKAAFAHIAEMRDVYAPKAAMIYSVTEVSNVYVDHTTFYPGDDFVDFVGVSAYNNKSSKATMEWGSYTDAFNGIGNYENPITKLKRIVDSFGDVKPILITECGFCYDSTKSEQTAEHAEEMLRYFYTYVNMVFPQVKGVFYFNTNFGGNSYKLFNATFDPLHGNAEVYREIMGSNAGFSALRNGKIGGYTEVRRIDEVMDSLELSVFASYPTSPHITVTYRWDNDVFATSETLPYRAKITKDMLTPGEHRLWVTTTCGTETNLQVYTVQVGEDGTVTVSVASGDTDLNGRVNISDVATMLKRIAGWRVDIDMDAADADGNGKVNLSDVRRVLKGIADRKNKA